MENDVAREGNRSKKESVRAPLWGCEDGRNEQAGGSQKGSEPHACGGDSRLRGGDAQSSAALTEGRGSGKRHAFTGAQ